jgi:hypothetical protein
MYTRRIAVLLFLEIAISPYLSRRIGAS